MQPEIKQEVMENPVAVLGGAKGGYSLPKRWR